MSSLPRPLGSFTNWVILRVGELVFIAGGLVVVFAQRQRLSLVLQASAVGVIFLLPMYFHPFAFGFADDQGITFCRYFKLHFVPWNEVARIQRRQRNAFELVVLLGKRVALTKTVKFPMKLAAPEVEATFHDGWIPDIVTWLIDHLPPAQAPRPQGSSPSKGHPDA
jgi:hypothetical protein